MAQRPEAEHPTDPQETIAPPAAPPLVAPAPPSAFHAVSEHEAMVEEPQRPVRRRRRSHAETQEATASLQLVETQAPTQPPPAEDALPRRTRPRRRRGEAPPSEPLMLVETQGGETPHADPPPSP